MDEEARPLGLTINWLKTKIQTMLDPAPAGNQVAINGHSVKVVESFPYLGSLMVTALRKSNAESQSHVTA